MCVCVRVDRFVRFFMIGDERVERQYLALLVTWTCCFCEFGFFCCRRLLYSFCLLLSTLRFLLSFFGFASKISAPAFVGTIAVLCVSFFDDDWMLMMMRRT